MHKLQQLLILAFLCTTGPIISAEHPDTKSKIQTEVITEAEKLLGLTFNGTERDTMLSDLREIASGHYRGPLHGIPYGAKDLLAVKGYKTSAASLSSPRWFSGALCLLPNSHSAHLPGAMYGMVAPHAIRGISNKGLVALLQVRTVEDCAIVFDAIRGPDGQDQMLIEAPFNYSPKPEFKSLRIGYLKSHFDEDYENKASDAATLDVLRQLGADLIPVTLPDYPIEALSFILSAEAAAAFDELTRSDRDDQLHRQIKNAWPNVFRSSRFIPAVEYIQANRVRYQVIQDMQKLMDRIDLYIAPSFGGNNLLLTNLTGHPCVVLPNGFDKSNHPVSITFIGRLFDEATILVVAQAYQQATDFHTQHPPEYP